MQNSEILNNVCVINLIFRSSETMVEMIMSRCQIFDQKLSKIWLNASVLNCEIKFHKL